MFLKFVLTSLGGDISCIRLMFLSSHMEVSPIHGEFPHSLGPHGFASLLT